MPGLVTTLHSEIATALSGHDWSGDIAGTVNVTKTWDAELEHKDIHATEPTLTVVPGALTVRRGDADDGFDPELAISVALRAKANDDARKDTLADFAEAVVSFITEIVTTQPIVEVELSPLFDLELLKTHRIWFSLIIVRCGSLNA